MPATRTHAEKTETLTTERLVLRPLVQADAPRLAELCSDLAVSRWLSRVPHPYTLADAEGFLAGLAVSEAQVWAIVPQDAAGAASGPGGTPLVGVVGLNAEPEGLSLGYWLGRAYWGQGWMTEAARAAVAVAFAGDIATLHSGVFEGNTASLAIQRRLGFVVTGERRLTCIALGQERRHIDTQLTRAAWEAGA